MKKFSKRRQKEQALYVVPAPDSEEQKEGPLSLDGALLLFLQGQNAMQHSIRTIKNYRHIIGMFIRYVREKYRYTAIEQVTERDILEWLSFLRGTVNKWGRPYSSRSVETFHRDVMAFFHWLVEHGHLKVDPMARLKALKVERVLIRIFTEDELRRLDAACDRPSVGRGFTEDERKALIARDRAFLWLLLSTGVRVSEACGLRFADIDWDEGLIYVRGKGAKERRIPFGKVAKQYLDTYIRYWRGVPLDAIQSDDVVFLNVFGNPLKPSAVEVLFARLKKVAGITDKRVSPHTCRHWFAVNAIKNGMPTIVLKNILGHETWEMIEVYVRLAEQDVKESYDRFSPVDALEMHKFPKGKRAQLRAYRQARRKSKQG
jgi:site-specific recombinase XerD